MTTNRRQSRAFRQLPDVDPKTGAPLDPPAVQPPSPELMDHLWARFGERPSLFEAETTGHSPATLMAIQYGREAVLDYLDTLTHGKQGA